MICRFCGNPLARGALVCAHCGQPTGVSASRYLSAEEPRPSARTGTIKLNWAAVFSAPDPRAEVVARLPERTRLPLLTPIGEFYQTRVNGMDGYVARIAVEVEAPPEVSVTRLPAQVATERPPSAAPARAPGQKARGGFGRTLAALGGVIALAGFLLPWTSCQGQVQSGLDLAQRGQMGSPDPPAHFVLFLVPVTALLLVGLWGWALRRRERGTPAAVGQLYLSAIGLTVLAAQVVALFARRTDDLRVEIGLGLTFIGYAVAILGGMTALLWGSGPPPEDSAKITTSAPDRPFV